MHDKDEPNLRDLDRMIDSALASYGDLADRDAVDPLEDRVLRGVVRRVNSEDRRRRLARWLTWTAALATAACIAALLALHPRQAPNFGTIARSTHSPEMPTQKQPPAIATARQPYNPPPVVRAGRPGVDRRLKHAAEPGRQPVQSEPLPKLDVFPAPYSPTEEEAALSFFIQHAPASEVQELLASRARLEAPVTINELEIPPIASLNNGGR
jgi:hypothetical protein